MKFLDMIGFICAFTWVLGIEVKASPGHEGHEEKTSKLSIVKSDTSAERPFLIGSSFEVVLNCCETGKTHIYVADRETNKAVTKATISIEILGKQPFKIEATSTQNTGEYLFTHQVKEGDKVELKINIKEETRAEILSTLITKWPKATGHCAEKRHA